MAIGRVLLPLLFCVFTALPLQAQFADDCASAGPIALGLNSFDCTMSTTDGLPLNPAICDMGPLGDEQLHRDVWALFTPATSENFEISTVGLAGFDTRIAVYSSATCPDSSIEVIACDDDATISPPFEAAVLATLTAGVTYKIRIGLFDETVFASPAQVRITPQGVTPLNNECLFSQGISEGTIPFDNSNATTNGVSLNPMICDMGGFGDEQIYHDIWFRFLPLVTKTYEVTTFGLAGFDTRLAIYEQATCPDDPDNVIACNDDLFGFPFEAGVTTTLNAGTQYIFRLGTYDPFTPGATGSLYVGDPGGPQVPSNDDCVNAEVIFEGVTPVNTTQATDGMGEPLFADVCDMGPFGDEQIYRDVWYFFTANATQTYRISTVNGVGFDSRLAVYDLAFCPDRPDFVIGCNDDGPGTFEAQVDVPLEQDETYMIRLGSYDSSTFGIPGTMTIGPVPPSLPPANDDCANAIALPPNFGTTPYVANGATTDGASSLGFCDYGAFGDEQNYNDVWFTYTPNVGGCTYISTRGLTAVDTRLTVYGTTTCPDDPAVILACVDDEILPITQPFNAGLDVQFIPGLTYLIRLGTYDSSTPNGVGSIRIEAGPQAFGFNAGANPGAPGCGPSPIYPAFCNGDGGDGMGCTNCPCGNEAASGTVGGCLNSAGTGARLLASGDPSVSLPNNSVSDLRFAANGVPANAFCIMNSGAAIAPQNAANPCFGANSGIQSMLYDGLRCAIGQTQRHGGRSADADGNVGVLTSPWGGIGAPPNGLARAFGGFMAGEVRYWQIIHREDPLLGCMRGLNTSQAVEVTFTP